MEHSSLHRPQQGTSARDQIGKTNNSFSFNNIALYRLVRALGTTTCPFQPTIHRKLVETFCRFTNVFGLRSDVSDFRNCVRSITLNPVFEFLYWRMNWHLEHHMFAGIPCYNLKKLHQLVAYDMPKTRTLRGVWREMLEIKRQQDIDPSYEFDTPVPEPIPKTTEEIKSLTDSIGDLAPKSLKYILTRP